MQNFKTNSSNQTESKKLKIYSGTNHSVCLNNQEIIIWGLFGEDSNHFCSYPKVFNINGNIRDVCVGDLLTVVLSEEGDVYTLGSSIFGQLGRKKREDANFYKGI